MSWEDLKSGLRDSDPNRRQEALNTIKWEASLDAATVGVETLESLAREGNDWAKDALVSIVGDPVAYDIARLYANRALERSGAGQKPSRPSDLEGSAREEALRRKAEFRQRAIQWWAQTDRATALCDDCNDEIPRDEGYLRPGYLACEECTDKMVSGYYS